MTKQLYSVFEIAERLQLHVKTVRMYVREGRLKATRIGKQYRIAREDLETFTGLPVLPTDRETAKRHRHVEAASVVQIDAIGPEQSARIESTVAAFGSAQRAGETLRIDTIYDRHLGRLKILVTGSVHASADVFGLIAKLSET